ncbi:hypothetical protein Tco_0551879 [Tanacetum coccineum]
MDLETTQTNAAAKLPLLKQGEYEMWRLRIEQYFQIQDYALWDLLYTEEKTQKKNDVKARILLNKRSKELQHQNMAFVSSPSSINEVNTANVQVSTANSSVSTDSTLDSTANLSDATVYAFLANQPNGSQLKTDSSRRTVNVEETSSKAMVAIDGAGFDWSFMAEEEVTTNMTLMAFSDSENLINLEFNIATYKRGFESVKNNLSVTRKNNVCKFSDHISVLKRDASFKDSKIIALKSEIEKLKIEKELEKPEFKGYKPKASKSVSVDTSNEIKKTPDTPLVEELMSKKEKQTGFPTKIEFVKQQDKTSRKPIKTHPNAQRNMVPRVVLMKTSLKPFNTARTVNNALPNLRQFHQPNDLGYVVVRVRGGKINGAGIANLVLMLKLHSEVLHVKRGRDIKIPQSSGPLVKVGDEAVHKELGDRMERAATTASSLEAEQDSDNINRT